MTGKTNTPTNLLEASILQEFDRQGLHIKDIRYLGGGRNSRVVRVGCDERDLVLKTYPQTQVERRDRLGTEVCVLEFLHQNGIDQVPEPLFWSREGNWAAFSVLEGSTIETVTPTLLEGVANFMAHLKSLGNRPEAKGLPVASEACFCLDDHVKIVCKRIQRLERIEGKSEIHDEALAWATEFLWPAMNKIMDLLTKNVPVDMLRQEVPACERVLSPSDVGIHNMLQMDRGVCFLDFEYAGWDDPAKFTVDWILQPDHPLSVEKAALLIEKLKTHIGSTSWPTRLNELLEIYRLKWCAIMLNVFLFEHYNKNSAALASQLMRTRTYFQESRALVSEIREVHG